MSWRNILGAGNTSAWDKSVKTVKASEQHNLVLFTDNAHEISPSSDAVERSSGRDERYRTFCEMVRQYGIENGLFIENEQISTRLSDDEREDVLSGRFSLTELRTMAEKLAWRLVVSRGLIPAGLNQIVICCHCGPVWMRPGTPTRVESCLWCDLDEDIIRASRPRLPCGECIHFVNDKINPAGGLGSCSSVVGDRRLCWPFSRHPCSHWRASTDPEN